MNGIEENFWRPRNRYLATKIECWWKVLGAPATGRVRKSKTGRMENEDWSRTSGRETKT
jgi:hypothetical protein